MRVEEEESDAFPIYILIGFCILMLVLYALRHKSYDSAYYDTPSSTSLPPPPDDCVKWEVHELPSTSIYDPSLTNRFTEGVWTESVVHLPDDRVMWISIPKSAPPASGYPVLWYVQPSGDYGMEQDTKNGGNRNINLRDAMRGVLNLGIAVVFIVPKDQNIWASYTDDGGYGYKCSERDYCWNDGNNRDMPYLQHTLAEAKKPKYSLDLDRVVLLGYSSGAQMASLIVDQQVSIGFPEIAGLILVAGGSQFCYAYDDGPLPAPFAPCYNESLGCCPRGITEARFMNSKETHPPTLLCQAVDDGWADVNFETLKNSNQPAAIITAEGTHHGITSGQIRPIVTFVRHNIHY